MREGVFVALMPESKMTGESIGNLKNVQAQVQDSPKRPGTFGGPDLGGGAEVFATGAYTGFAAGQCGCFGQTHKIGHHE